METPRELAQELAGLEAVSRLLEPDAQSRERIREPFVHYTERFLEALQDTPAYRSEKRAALALRDLPVPEEPTPPETLVDLLEENVDRVGLNAAHPGHVAYIPGGGLYPSALGDYVAAVTNHYAGIAYAGPGAAQMEDRLVRWMAEITGLPSTAGGNLASGGSVANLIAVITAREARPVRSEDVPTVVVYSTSQAHHCVDKALHMAGLGECVRRTVPMDEGHRMDPAGLRELVTRDRREGLEPWLVVASAGTTDAGAVDPLEAVADVARDEGLWYHVDAAYGGFFALSPRIRPRLKGMERADSLVLDPHKGLFLPYGLGAVLVRDDDLLRRAHTGRGAYLQDAEAEQERIPSPADRSPELTKHWRAPRMWLPLMLFGLRPFRAALEEKILLARYFRKQAREMGFETGPEPDLSVVLYRWVPAEGDPDAFNRELVRRLHQDGRVFVSSTTLGGTFYLRFAVLSFRTHRETVDLYLEMLTRILRDLGEEPSAPEVVTP